MPSVICCFLTKRQKFFMCFHKSPYFSYKKSRQKNFPPITPLYFGKVFEVTRDFSRKVSCVRVWGGQPQLITLTKKHGIAVLFNYRNVLELRSKPCFKRLFVKSPLKIRKNLAPITPPYFYKVFEVPRDFLQKVPWSGFGADSPNIQRAGNHGTIIKSVPATIIASPSSDFFVRRSLKTK